MKQEKAEDENTEKTCFVIMPISDTLGYSQGHFKRVYDYLIKPACVEAGFTPLRADDVKGTNSIVIDILRRIISADMAICDLSSKNPNVLYELGVRQSFDLPVTFIKDDLTDRIFDIQGFRDTPYSSSLRIDEVELAISSIAANLRETFDNKGKDINSIVELLGISKATIKDPITLSDEGVILLNALNEIREKINGLSQNINQVPKALSLSEPYINPNWDNNDLEPANSDSLSVGDIVEHLKFGTGRIKMIDIKGKEKKATINFTWAGEKILLLSFAKLKTLKKSNIP